MTICPDRPGGQRLGAYIMGLGPGDECPCCGAAMHTATESSRGLDSLASARGGERGSCCPGSRALGRGASSVCSPRDFGNPGGLSSGGLRLVCLECGCELGEISVPFAGEKHPVLIPAA